MVRTIIKGGVWKNTEDEVLKAAIAKYGKNQWARISSLLVRKTPKQCKARWYEWLDPSIKKTEWSKEEDEKLLHLAKLMPTQWRTIAPIVGRTATQCLERYQKLLDEAEAKEHEELGLAGPSDGAIGPSADEVRKLRPGEIDPDPETKPARPDPIDMDEDEKEMLSEARARLANTQGKKAKRKARERQLEEARRLAVLQKKRELKAAGIIMRSKTKRKGMDYNADIPFEKKPAPGFYDTSEEQSRIMAAPVGQTLRRLENKRKPDAEEEERRKRQKRESENKEPGHQTKFVPSREAQIQKLKEAESIGRRRKLVLPNAQVGESELEEIVKIGLGSEEAKALVAAGGNEASGRLLSDDDGGLLEGARMARTPRTVAQYDTVLTEARNLRNMTVSQTPLLGEENTPLHVAPGGEAGTGFEGATPRHQIPFTPNPLATPRNLVDGTPATPLRTPLRDSLSINPEDYAPAVNKTPRDQRLHVSASKRALQSGFMSLPKPENNFELVVPDENEDVDEGDAEREGESVEDAAQRDLRIKKRKEEEERRELARRSEVIKRGLPRPANVDVSDLFEKLNSVDYDDGEGDDENQDADRLLNTELVQLIQHDSIVYPLPGTTRPGSSAVSTYTPPDDDSLGRASDEIHQELAKLLGFPSASPGQVKEGLMKLAKAEADGEGGLGREELGGSWACIRKNLVYDVKMNKWVEPTELSEGERVKGYGYVLERKKENMLKEAAKLAKVEKKLGIILGGYQRVGQSLSQRVESGFEKLRESAVELSVFKRLKGGEEGVVEHRRVSTLEEEVRRLEVRESMGQSKYEELGKIREELVGRVTELEERVMEFAEGVNEERLKEMEGVDGS